MGYNTIKSFKDLIAWQEGHKLVLSIYKVTKKFPPEEKFSLIDQMRRAATSITSNLAEGFSRYGKNEKKQFYRISLGSLTELQNQIIIAKDLDYISSDEFQFLEDQTITVSKLNNGLIKSLNT